MSTFSQLFPPAPRFTESSLEDLRGHVYIVTGATSGVGLELAKMLYSRNATIHVGGRSVETTTKAIGVIRTASPKSTGSVEPLIIDLANLASVRTAANVFITSNQRLDVLFHNAGVMTPPEGSKSIDGYDIEMGTNCLGPFLLTRLLEGVLGDTVAQASKDSVRIVWVSSMVNVGTPEGGVRFDRDGNPVQLKAMDNYMQSKAGDLFLAHEFAERLGPRGITSVSLHPGLMKTELQRNSPPPQRIIMSLVFKGPKYGAYTELYAGLSHEVKNGGFYIPWGRAGTIPDHLVKSTKASSGGKSVAETFYDWCEAQTSKHML